MSDPTTYSFYGTTVPVLKNLASTAINILTAAKAELSNAADGTLPTEQELLDSRLGDMLPLRFQPILLAKFPTVALEEHKLNGASPFPKLSPAFTSFDDIITFLEMLRTAYNAIDEKAYNESAEKGASVHFETANVTLQMSGMADYFHGFVIPNSYFHLNAMYMLLRSKGFKLGKEVYIGAWMSEQQHKDWAPLRATMLKK